MTPTSPVAARAARTTSSRTASAPFWGLMFFTFILYLSPQVYMPFLQPLRLAMVSAGLAILLYLLDRIFRGGGFTVMIPPIKLVLIFFVLAGLSIPSSLWPGGSFEFWTNDLLKSILIFLLLANTVDTIRRMKLLIASLACWGTFMAISGARDFSAGILNQGRIAGYESALAGNPNDLAFVLNLMMAVILGVFFSTRNMAHRVLLGAAVAIMSWGVITTFSRAGFLTLAAMGIVLVIERIRKGDTLTVLAVLALVACIIVIAPSGYSDRLYSIVDIDADPTGSARGRYEGTFTAIEFILGRPLIGAGLGMNGLAFVEQGGPWTVVHNVFLQVGADLGIPALIVYVLILLSLFRGVNAVMAQLRTGPRNDELAALTTGVRLALIAFTVGAFFQPAAYHFYFFYTAGLAVAVQNIALNLRATAETVDAARRSPARSFSQSRWISASPRRRTFGNLR
jgi:putative inorganic carbon (hco3(-)) transporter